MGLVTGAMTGHPVRVGRSVDPRDDALGVTCGGSVELPQGVEVFGQMFPYVDVEPGAEPTDGGRDFGGRRHVREQVAELEAVQCGGEVGDRGRGEQSGRITETVVDFVVVLEPHIPVGIARDGPVEHGDRLRVGAGRPATADEAPQCPARVEQVAVRRIPAR